MSRARRSLFVDEVLYGAAYAAGWVRESKKDLLLGGA